MIFEALCSVEKNRACWPGTCGSTGLGRDCSCNAGFITIRNHDGTVAHCQCMLKVYIEIEKSLNIYLMDIFAISEFY